jgi:cellulose synthase/poly-beta-1,6-N-acetylglucosamine synthase-like glycosyltransferase
MTDFFTPNTVLFNGLLPSLLINVVIWILTPFIVALTVIAFVLYSMGVLTEKISH